MPKNLSRHLPILNVSAVCLLLACGQSGSLYLPDTPITDNSAKPTADKTAKTRQAEQQPTPVSKKNDRITTTLMTVETLNITGKRVQLDPSQQQSWQALLATDANDDNPLRYVTFDGNVLDKSQPLTVLVGHPQNKTIETRISSTIVAGLYLRVRSLETGINHIPTLIAVADNYLKHTPTIRRANNSDFLIDTQDNIDLFIAVEAK